MLQTFTKVGNTLRKAFITDKDVWINLSSPTESEVEEVATKLDIPVEFLTDSLDIDERSRVEVREDTVFMVIRVPKANDGLMDLVDINVPFVTLPVGLVLGRNFILTVCLDKNLVCENYIERFNLNDFSYSSRKRLILLIFQKTALMYLSFLRQINRKISEVEEKLHEAMKNEELIELLNLEKSLVYFTTSLRSNELMIEKLRRSNVLKLDADDNELLEDVIVDNKQAIETANIYSNILSGMMDAFASIISNNLNIVMKFLTSVTIILMLPTLVASIYGMNIKLPFQDSPYAFLITMVISFVLSALGVFIFIRNKWF